MQKPITLFFLLMCLFGSVSSQEKILFKLSPLKGVAQYYDIEYKFINNDPDKYADVSNDFIVSITPTEISDHYIHYTLKFEKVKVVFKNTSRTISYDSENLTTNIYEKVLARAFNSQDSIKVITDRFGKLCDIQAPDTSNTTINVTVANLFRICFPNYPMTYGDSYDFANLSPEEQHRKIKAVNKLIEKNSRGYVFNIISSEDAKNAHNFGDFIVDSDTFNIKYGYIIHTNKNSKIDNKTTFKITENKGFGKIKNE